jgi:hypothetical protein
VNISQTKSFHPSILALQDGTRGPAPLSDIPYWVVEARELAGTIVHPMFINSFDALWGHPCPFVGGRVGVPPPRRGKTAIFDPWHLQSGHLCFPIEYNRSLSI